MSAASNVETVADCATKNSRAEVIRECTAVRDSIQKASGTMSDWQKLIAAADVPVGSGKEFAASGRIVALFNVDGQFQAIDGICAHQGGPLVKGQLVDGVVTCPWHGWQYELATGNHAPTCKPMLKTYKIQESNGVMEIDLPI